MDKRNEDIIRAAKDLLEKWDDCDPGPNQSWDDCCDDMKPSIDKLRQAFDGTKG